MRFTRRTSNGRPANGKRYAVTRTYGCQVTLPIGAVPGLSTEMVERLERVRPETSDQASRIAGVTPAALSALYVALNRRAAA